jgi:hypothetical protein
LAAVDPNDIERINFTSSSRRSSRPRLDHERRRAFLFVTQARFATMDDVEVAGEKDVGAGTRQLFHCYPCASHESPFAVPLGQIKRVMGHNKPCNRWS